MRFSVYSVLFCSFPGFLLNLCIVHLGPCLYTPHTVAQWASERKRAEANLSSQFIDTDLWCCMFFQNVYFFFPFWLQFCQISPTAYSLFNFLKRAVLLSRALILLLRKSSWIMTNMDLGIKNTQDLKFLTTLNTQIITSFTVYQILWFVERHLIAPLSLLGSFKDIF